MKTTSLAAGAAGIKPAWIITSLLFVWLLRSNAFGLGDFLVAAGVGIALRSTNFGGPVSADVMASLPLSLIPTFTVPVCLILHVMIILQYRGVNHGT